MPRSRIPDSAHLAAELPRREAQALRVRKVLRLVPSAHTKAAPFWQEGPIARNLLAIRPQIPAIFLSPFSK